MRHESTNTEWSGSLIITRDVLILLICLLTLALVYLVAPKLLRSNADTQAAVSVSTTLLSASNDIPVTAVNTPQPNPASAVSIAADTQTPSPTPGTVPSTTASPTENGDFSATFATSGVDDHALYSEQTDTVKLSIDKVQTGDITYFVADVYVKNIEAFQTAFAKGSYGRGLLEMPL